MTEELMTETDERDTAHVSNETPETADERKARDPKY